MRREFALRRCGRMKKMTYTELCREVRGANLVLVGIGEDLEGDLDGLYRSLSELLQKKDYFIVTLKDRDSLEKQVCLQNRSLLPFRRERTQ